MTDFLNDGIFANLSPMIFFMIEKPADLVDALVARALKLRWDAYAKNYSLPKQTTASAITLHAAIFADVVLTEVQKHKHYSFLEPIVEALQAEYGFLLDQTLDINSSPNVIEHIAHFEAMLDLCEKAVDSEEVKGAIPQLFNAFYGPVDLSSGDMEHQSVVSHELMPNSHEFCYPTRIDYEGGAVDERLFLGDYPLDAMLILASNPEAYADFATTEFADLEQLVAIHVKENPELLKNVLFRKLVEKCADTIAYATNAGKELNFITSHSSFGGSMNKVFLTIAGVPFGITIDDDLDDPQFKVVRQGITDKSIKTGADLLDLVKKSIG